MKTLKAPCGTFFRYQGDRMLGSIEVVHPDSSQSCRLVASDLLWFVARYVADRRIEELEQAEPEEILGIPARKES